MTPQVGETTPRGNAIDRRIHERNIILGALIAEDRWAIAALDRKDDLALIRRIVKADISGALEPAIERAWMRGNNRARIAKAVGVTSAELSPYVAKIYTQIDA